MSSNSAPMIHQLQENFEQLLTLITRLEEQNATLYQMECYVMRCMRHTSSSSSGIVHDFAYYRVHSCGR